MLCVSAFGCQSEVTTSDASRERPVADGGNAASDSDGRTASFESGDAELASPDTTPPSTRPADAGPDLAWRAYPFRLVADDPEMVFPASEGYLAGNDSNTWFVAGKLRGASSGRSFAFLAMFIQNLVADSLPSDFYSISLFDLDAHDYGTFTEYDFPPASLLGPRKLEAASGHLDLRFSLQKGAATWQTKRAGGELVPFSYVVDLPGTDQTGRAIALTLDVDPTNPPVPVGADAYQGVITCFGQENTKSWFQTGLQLVGHLHWGDVDEDVTGNVGHIDRQWFPEYAGVHAGSDGRDRSHEWGTIFFDNGLDVSLWQQFDRTLRNALTPFVGVTAYDRDTASASFSSDLRIEILSYVKSPKNGVAPLLAPRANTIYFPDRYRLQSAELGIDVTAAPLVPAPLLALPVEYMHSPVALRGTLHSQPVEAFGFWERTLTMYRDFELVEVLRVSVANLPPEAFASRQTDVASLVMRVADLAAFVDRRDNASARRHLQEVIVPVLEQLAPPHAAAMLAIASDVASVL